MKLPNRFMVIDDDPINNHLCETVFKRHYNEVDIHMYLQPEVAIKTIEEEYIKNENEIPTVLFLDINMPGMTGWEFLDAFKTLPAKVHQQFNIFILSSSIDGRDVERASSDPFVSGFISKPLVPKILNQIFFKWAT